MTSAVGGFTFRYFCVMNSTSALSVHCPPQGLSSSRRQGRMERY